MSFTVKPLPNTKVGIQITDLDLSQEISEQDKKKLYDLWIESGIIVFKGLGHNAEEHIRLSSVFGDPKPHAVRHLNQESDNPEFMVLDSKDFERIGTYYRESSPNDIFTGYIPWHSDLIFTTQPNHGAMLRIVEFPEHGGNTAWLDTIAAYDALSDEVKAKIANLEVEYELCQDHLLAKYGRDETIHAAKPSSGAGFDKFPPVAHPVVVTHPISGKKCLNISPLHLVRIVNMTEADSDALIKMLVKHVTDQQFVYEHHWEANDMVLWDNWRTLHTALGYPASEPRRGVRTQIYGNIKMGRILEPTA